MPTLEQIEAEIARREQLRAVEAEIARRKELLAELGLRRAESEAETESSEENALLFDPVTESDPGIGNIVPTLRPVLSNAVTVSEEPTQIYVYALTGIGLIVSVCYIWSVLRRTVWANRPRLLRSRGAVWRCSRCNQVIALRQKRCHGCGQRQTWPTFTQEDVEV